MKKLWKTIGIIIGISAVLSVVASLVVHMTKKCNCISTKETTERTYTTIE